MTSRESRAVPTGESRLLPALGSGLPRARRNGGLLLVALGLPVLTAVLVELRDSLALATTLLLYLLAVVVTAVVGGVVPAVLGAVVSLVLANWFLTPPYNTLAVASRDSLIELVVFLFVAVAVSATVEIGARRRVSALRSRLEADLLSRFAGQPVAHMPADEVLDQIRGVFGMTSMAVTETHDDVDREVVRVGPEAHQAPVIEVAAGPGLRLLGWGPGLFAEDRRLLGSLAQAAGRAVEGQRLAEEAAKARELAAIDRLRSALLAAVGHELRTPLAGAKAAVSSLRQHDISWTPDEQEELLATIEESTDRLADLIADLLDLSRLQAGAVSVNLAPVALDEIVYLALAGSRDHHDVVNEISDDLPLVMADAGLLERVIANLVENATRFARPGLPARLVADAANGEVRLSVVDRGPGVPPERWDRMFVPFQRLDDRTTGGLGLGLAIARGFTEAMQGRLQPSTTPGGGLTMTLALPVA
jgi:K+-sensing histidine kinase KdpD